MALTRQQKEQRVTKTAEDIADATAMVFMAFDGLDVDDAEELRDKLHAEGVKMRVLPKRLLRLVLTQLKVEFDPTAHEGQLAVLWGSDAVAPARILHTFAKTHESVKLLAGTLEGEVLELAQVQALATLPSREQMLGLLVATLAAPISGLQTVLNGVQRQTVYVLTAIAKQKNA